MFPRHFKLPEQRVHCLVVRGKHVDLLQGKQKVLSRFQRRFIRLHLNSIVRFLACVFDITINLTQLISHLHGSIGNVFESCSTALPQKVKKYI